MRLLKTCALLTYQFGPSWWRHPLSSLKLWRWSLAESVIRIFSPFIFFLGFSQGRFLLPQALLSSPLYSWIYRIYFYIFIWWRPATLPYIVNNGPRRNHHLSRSSYRHQHLRMRGTAIRRRISYSPSWNCTIFSLNTPCFLFLVLSKKIGRASCRERV